MILSDFPLSDCLLDFSLIYIFAILIKNSSVYVRFVRYSLSICVFFFSPSSLIFYIHPLCRLFFSLSFAKFFTNLFFFGFCYVSGEVICKLNSISHTPCKYFRMYQQFIFFYLNLSSSWSIFFGILRGLRANYLSSVTSVSFLQSHSHYPLHQHTLHYIYLTD